MSEPTIRIQQPAATDQARAIVTGRSRRPLAARSARTTTEPNSTAAARVWNVAASDPKSWSGPTSTWPTTTGVSRPRAVSAAGTSNPVQVRANWIHTVTTSASRKTTIQAPGR